MPRLSVVIGLGVAVVVASALPGCFDDPPAKGAPPPGTGYGKGQDENRRLLTQNDCIELREQQVGLAAKEQTSDPIQQEQLAAKLRVDRKEELAKWVKWCTGRIVDVKDLRCMKESATLKGFLACGTTPDAGPDAPADAPADAP